MSLSIIELPSFQNFKSLFDMQYFVCPLCPFKWHSKQGFVDHAWQKHPDMVENMKNLQDGSMDDVIVPWHQINSNDDFTEKNNIPEEEKETVIEINEESLGNQIPVVNEEEISDDTTEIVTTTNTEDSKEYILKFTNFECAECKLLYNILSQHSCTSLQELKTQEENESENENVSDDKSHTSLKSELVEICVPLKRKTNFKTLKYTISEDKNKSGVYEVVKKVFKCKKCEKSYSEHGSLTKHIDAVHKNIKKSCKCETCGKVFSRKQDWKKHVSRHGDNDFKCDFCEKSFVLNNQLERHVYITHKGHKEEKTTYKCGTCGKQYKNYASLKAHIRIVHEGRKDYNCIDCGLLYALKRDLDAHVQKVHEKINITQSHMCETCGKSLTTAATLKHHIWVIHDGHKDHKCDQCSSSFAQKSDLKRHVDVVHNGQKNYNCKACSKSFGRSSTLQEHIRSVHEGQRNNKCETCGKTFFQKTDMQRHIDSVHLKKPDVWKRKKKFNNESWVSQI